MPITDTTLAVKNRFRRYYTDIAPIIKKPRVKASTSAVFSFLAISLFLWYAVRPTASTIIYLRREIEDKTTLNQQMEAKITSLIEAQTSYESIKDSLPLLEQALPHQPDAVILARQIRNIANISQASIAAIQIPGVPITTDHATPGAKIANQKPLEEYTVNVVLSGSYPAIKSFLENILLLRRITAIDQLSIKQDGNLRVSGELLQLSLRLKTYYSMQ